MPEVDADDRVFMRELLRRHEKASEALLAVVDRLDEGPAGAGA
jgi:hypothetical protein